MKKCIIYIIPLLLLCSCAVSERAVRMSGGVIDEYSAPKSYRIRSRKYQAKSRALGSDQRISRSKVAGLNDTLVNVWPFFFASNNYWCALWPMIDSDPYGFAVRPLFNKEGDDCSVLFPLSAWNTSDKSGWIVNFVWEKRGFGFIPLTYQSWSDTTKKYYYTPLFIRSVNTRKLTPQLPFRTDSSFFCCLAYGEKSTEVKKTDTPHGWIFSHRKITDAFRNEWRYRYRKGNAPGKLPETAKELDTLKEQIFKMSPVVTDDTFGVFPLFHATNSSDGKDCFYMAGPFLAMRSKSENSSWQNLLFGLLFYSKESVFPTPFSPQGFWSHHARDNRIYLPFLFSGAHTWQNYTGKRFEIFSGLKAYRHNEPFSEAVPRLEKELKKISPDCRLPKEVVDWNTFNIYKSELAKKEQFETSTFSSFLAGPFFYCSKTPDKSKYVFPILLSGTSFSKDRSFFLSIPLLSWSERTSDKSAAAVLPPVIYWENSRKKSKLNKKIYSSDCQWSGKYQTVEEINKYAALGLFYRGKFAFTVAKEGVDHKAAEFVRKNLLELGTAYQSLEKERTLLAGRRKNALAWKTANKIEHYKKLIRLEELKAEEENLVKREKKLNDTRREVQEKASQLGVNIPDRAFSNRKESEKEVEKLLEKLSVTRWKEDIGNGLFFRKENFYNGNYHWHFCHILAGGSKSGDKESTHILHLLYRFRKESDRSETIVFPFISHVKEGESERTSFLWRLFSIGKRNGKTGGHILFIPFGEAL